MSKIMTFRFYLFIIGVLLDLIQNPHRKQRMDSEVGLNAWYNVIRSHALEELYPERRTDPNTG